MSQATLEHELMNISFKRHIIAAIVVLGFALPGHAAQTLRLANSFGSFMVLQRDMPVPVWGWSAPQSEVTVTFKDQRKTARADADGRWRVVFDAMAADARGSALNVEARGEKVSAEDVVVGDVWLCAGPGIARSMSGLQNAKAEIAQAKFPGVRILRPDSYTSVLPVADIPAPVSWVPVTPEGIVPFSVTWYFGRELHLAGGVPVGLVLVNRAGMAREWIAWKLDPKDGSQTHALRQLKEQLPHDIERAESWLFNMQNRRGDDPVDLLLFPCHIPFNFYGVHPAFGAEYPIGFKSYITYNASVGPLVPMAIRGVLFNCEFDDKSAVAANDLKQVVLSWREAWERPGLPFVLSEPVLKQAQAASVEVALKSATTLPGVVKVARPQTFSEQKSEDYWKSLALVAKEVPVEQGINIPPHAMWSQPAIVKAEPAPTRRQLEAAHVFGDNMVLQCDQPINVWGWCEPGERVTVSFAGQSAQATADASGRWQVALAAVRATDKPDTMSIATKTDRLKFENVVVGEVWVNSGQSNAGFVMSATLGFDEEQPKATNTAIRCFFNAKAAAVLPQRRNLGEWRVLSPETVGRMSGMGYYFARSIHREKPVPVGIVEANHGGSTIFSWTTEAALASSPKFATLAGHQQSTREEAMRNFPLVEHAVRAWVAEARKNDALTRPMMPFPIDASPVRPFYSAFLQNPMERRGCMFYHTMIQPMTGFSIRGVLWNQGEADGDKTAIYDDLMATMVADWRKQWRHEFPFYFVQMPARKGDAGLVSMWQAQTRALAKIPRSGMIICNDISEPGTRYEVHPRDKRNVGERLARLALARTYGVKGLIDASPMMESVTRDGRRAIVTFSTPGEGLKTRDGKPSDSWELAGADGKFVPATAEVSGVKVALTAASVDQPAFVRLGWESDSNCNLVNSAALPAMPFSAAVPSGNK
jgi:sialate O-acetylesterase